MSLRCWDGLSEYVARNEGQKEGKEMKSRQTINEK